jgi:hypothetical protein
VGNAIQKAYVIGLHRQIDSLSLYHNHHSSLPSSAFDNSTHSSHSSSQAPFHYSKMTMTAMNAFVLVLCLFAVKASAFQISGPSVVGSRAGRAASSSTVLFSADTTAEKTSDDKASLTFVCDTVIQSDSIPGDTTPEQVHKFLQQPAQRDCVISGGNQNKVEVVETFPDLLHAWKVNCRTVGATAVPESTDCVLQVSTGATAFPGLTLTSNVYIGSKLLGPSEDDAFPVYEFVLIKDEQSVEGFKPAVWLFEKLTGANGKNKEQPNSLSRVTAVRQNDGDIVFQTTSNLTIKLSFPKLLLRLFPSTKEQAEEQASAVIVKKVEADLKTAMRVLREQYLAQL